MNPASDVWYDCGARVTAPRFVMKSCSSRFYFINPSYPSLNSTPVHSCFIIHSQQIFMNVSWTSHFQQLRTHTLTFWNQLGCAIMLSETAKSYIECNSVQNRNLFPTTCNIVQYWMSLCVITYCNIMTDVL
jgi:hypothetical protein